MIQKTILDNGVRLISERLDNAFSVTVGLWLGVGSRDEEPAISGASHFIEHMAFKGTRRRSALEIAREIDLLGGMANAFTSKEHTCYHARALAEKFPELSDLLLDLLLEPAFDQAELERERQVILQEISMVEDTPDELVHVLFGNNFWPGHPLGRSVLGTLETVSGLDRETVMAYLAGAYQPSQLVVAAVGNLEHQELLDLMAGPLGRLKPQDPPLQRSQPTPGAGGWHVVRRQGEQAHLIMGKPAPSAVHEDRFTAALLNLILGGNMSSRLFQEVRERRGLAYAVYSFLSSYCDSGLLGIYLGVSPARAEEAKKVVEEQMAILAGTPVTPEELAHAKENLKGSILLAAEAPDIRMSRLARTEFNFGRPVPLDEVVENIEAVKLDDLSRLAVEMLDPASLAGTALGPLGDDFQPGEVA